MKFEIVAVLARIATFATPLLITYAVWQHNEISTLANDMREVMVWKEDAPDRIAMHHAQTKMEVMMLVSGQLLEIQKSLVEMRTEVRSLVKQQEQRDERRNQAGE
jgi:hypothetical protein